MRGPGTTGQALAAIVGALMVLSGLAGLIIGGTSAAAGAWLLVVGLILVVVALVERRRYRSETADRTGLPIGPGGGEPIDVPMDGRFQRTDERFLDPTSGHTMRVWLDRTTGERRYRAED